jgi:hypothetical protein
VLRWQRESLHTRSKRLPSPSRERRLGTTKRHTQGSSRSISAPEHYELPLDGARIRATFEFIAVIWTNRWATLPSCPLTPCRTLIRHTCHLWRLEGTAAMNCSEVICGMSGDWAAQSSI